MRELTEIQPLQLVIAKIAVETGIFRALSNVEKGSSLSLHDIAKATNVHPLLLGMSCVSSWRRL